MASRQHSGDPDFLVAPEKTDLANELVERQITTDLAAVLNFHGARSEHETEGAAEGETLAHIGQSALKGSTSKVLSPIRTAVNFGECLGVGAFGAVYSGVSRNGKDIAVKTCPKGKADACEALRREHTVLSLCRDDSIVAPEGDLFETANDLAMPMERLHETTEQHLTEPDIRAVGAQVLRALCYLHHHRFAHRDVKPANIMFASADYRQVKLCDFGLSRSLDEEWQTVGTPPFMSREAWEGQKCEGVDIWAFGCTLCAWCSATGKDAWGSNAVGVGELFYAYQLLNYQRPHIPKGISRELADVIERCLDFDPDNRSTAGELLEHPFFNKDQNFAPDQLLNSLDDDDDECHDNFALWPRAVVQGTCDGDASDIDEIMSHADSESSMSEQLRNL